MLSGTTFQRTRRDRPVSDHVKLSRKAVLREEAAAAKGAGK
jgi:hypothetical protein